MIVRIADRLVDPAHWLITHRPGVVKELWLHPDTARKLWPDRIAEINAMLGEKRQLFGHGGAW